MTGSGSPCGACKFLRRKCVKGCIFAPYFCHDQGVNHFAAIHKVFGASNVSKLLAHLPVSDRCEAAVTISYEAQARLQDPIYGCVSHIFALQQQVVSLQAQLASMKEQAAQSFSSGSAFANPNGKVLYGKLPFSQAPQDWFEPENKETVPQFNPNLAANSATMTYHGNGVINPNSMEINYENSVKIPDENASYRSFEEVSCFDMQMNNRQYCSFQEADELQSMAFGYINQHS
ncbi:LOB domain-containing protein 29-like [Ziziphus jujuba]|uniref:LOB domain-containing protein 29 n=1 Tax=Ziziphus jujuba TaxID=326968 RepID=A0A6P6GF18_ZIZJJ|nr:LOB domain-containing protein 29 [Ziziphus jujuba]XP_060667662.1 LOB domain-containing protein 29-like [Ziziphus jujuba]